MKAYVMSTGVVFGLLALVHVWRVIEEGFHLAAEPWFVAITVIAAGLSAWSWRVLWRMGRP